MKTFIGDYDLWYMDMDMDTEQSGSTVGDQIRLQQVQYIPRNMHTVLLGFALLWLRNCS